LNIVGALRLAGGGIRKLRKKRSFVNTFFQIVKRRCKDFLVSPPTKKLLQKQVPDKESSFLKCIQPNDIEERKITTIAA